MTRLVLSYLNYEHGGRADANYTGDGGGFDLDGLVRVMTDGTAWPDVLAIGEADRWEFNGREGAHEAAAALRAAGGPPYVPYTCSLPRQGGPFAPAFLVDPRTVVVRRFYDHRLPDFASRNRNLLAATLARGGQQFRLIAVHGDIHSGDQRLADARELDRFARPDIPCAVLGDWNGVPSGPAWEPSDLNTPGRYTPQQLAWRTRFQHGPAQAGPHDIDTRALDFLLGWWDPDQARRIGGLGFHDAAELAADPTPTQIPRPSGRQPLTIDRILLNQPWAEAMAKGSYQVHPAAPDHPSDHLRISVAIDT